MQQANIRANLMDFEKTLKTRKLFLFTPQDIHRLFGWSITSVKFLLLRYLKRGIITRLKKGVYLLRDTRISDFVIANRLQEPSYVSLETALSFYRIIPETVYVTTSVTTTRPSERIALDKAFQYHRIPPRAFTGYVPFVQDNTTCYIADPEKAFVDYYYFVARGLREPLDTTRTHREKLDKQKIVAYARLFANAKLDQLLKNLILSSL